LTVIIRSGSSRRKAISKGDPWGSPWGFCPNERWEKLWNKEKILPKNENTFDAKPLSTPLLKFG